MSSALDALQAALAAPTPDEAAEVRAAVAAAVAAGGGFVAAHFRDTGRLFTALIVGDVLVRWTLDAVRDADEAHAMADMHGRAVERGLRRMQVQRLAAGALH